MSEIDDLEDAMPEIGGRVRRAQRERLKRGQDSARKRPRWKRENSAPRKRAPITLAGQEPEQ